MGGVGRGKGRDVLFYDKETPYPSLTREES